MRQTLTVELTDETYAGLQRQANATGASPSQLAAESLERQFGSNGTPAEAERRAARERFERHFGEIDLGQPTGADNESIDADLAREYASTHEES